MANEATRKRKQRYYWRKKRWRQRIDEGVKTWKRKVKVWGKKAETPWEERVDEGIESWKLVMKKYLKNS